MQDMSKFKRWLSPIQNSVVIDRVKKINPCPAEPGYALPLQTVLIQISWLLKKPTDLDLHCLSYSM